MPCLDLKKGEPDYGARNNNQPKKKTKPRHEFQSKSRGGAVGEHDFAPFAKGEESTGFGLGLSIVRRLCERHAIDLRFEQGEDGTVAYLPLRKGAGLSPASRTPSALRAGD